MLNLSARKLQISIGGADFSTCLVSFQGSDDHVNSGNGLVTFNGQMVLGKSQGFNQSLDDRKNPTRYCRGVQVLISIANTTGTLQRHPRGSLRILKSSYDDETKRLTLELGDLIGLLNFKEPTNPDEANNKSLEGKTGGYIITRLLQVAGINAINGSLPDTTYNYPINLSGSYLDTVGKLLYAHNLIGWIDKNEVFQIRPCDITGGGAGVAINVGETELYYKRLSGAETPVEKVKAVGNESVVSESPDYLRDYSEKIGLASGIHPDYPDTEIIIESTEKVETWDKDTHTKIVTETTKKPYGIIIPEVFWNVTPSGEIISRLDRLIDAEINIKTYKYSHDKETNILTNAQDETYETRGGCRLISLVEETYQPRGTYLGEVKEARDNYNINEYATALTKKITTNYTYTEKDIIKLITSNTLEMDVIIKNGTDESWDAYTTFGFEYLVPSGQQTQEWKKITKDTWEYKSSGTGCLVRINKEAVIFKENSETDSNKLTLIPNPELSINRSSNSGQEQPPATERCPAEVNIEDKQIKVTQIFGDACNNGLKPRERTFSVDLLAGRLEPYLAPGEAIDGLSVDSEARTQLRAIALREGRLLRGRDKGQQIATNIQDTLFNYYPLYPVHCREKDGTVQAYLADGSSWVLSANRALWSCDGIWTGTFAGSPTIVEGIAPDGSIARFYSKPITVDIGMGIGFNSTSYSYSFLKDSISSDFGTGVGINPFPAKELINSEFGIGFGFDPTAVVTAFTANFGIGVGFDPLLIAPVAADFGIGVGFDPLLIAPVAADFGIGVGFDPFPAKELINSEFGIGVGFDPFPAKELINSEFGIGVGFDPLLIAPVVADPYFSSVVLLLHFDGSNNSTIFTDSSDNTKSVTTFNGASLTTTFPKFGTACANFTSNQYAEIPANVDFQFGTGLFTIDFWIKTTQGSGFQQVIGQFYPSVSSGEFSIRPSNAGGLGGGIGIALRTASTFLDINSGFNINDGNWHFIRVIRDSPTTLKIGVDGVTRLNYTSLSSSQTIGRPGLGLRMSRNEWDGNRYFAGQIDDLKISKGVARDVSELPTAAFPDN